MCGRPRSSRKTKTMYERSGARGLPRDTTTNNDKHDEHEKKVQRYAQVSSTSLE